MKNDEQLRDKWMPRFHACIALAFSIFYLLLRSYSASFPRELYEFMRSRGIEVFFFVGLFGSIITGVAISSYLKSKTPTISFQEEIGEALSQKSSYFLPYRYSILFIILTELYILFAGK